MTYKNVCIGVLFFFTTFVISQNKEKKTSFSAEVITVEGCQFEEDVYQCSTEKLQRATFQFLQPADVLNVAKITEKDTILVNVSLTTNKSGEILEKDSFLNFYESEMKPLAVEVTTPIEEFEIELASVSKKQNGYISKHLFLKIDRENNVFIPLYDYVPKRIPFSGPEVGVIYPGCSSAKTNEERKRCMSTKISQFIAKRFNTRLGKKLGLDGVQRIYVVFKINLQGKPVDIRARGPHPRLEKEAIRIIKKLPKMIPATIENIPISVAYTLPIVFTVRGKRSN
ncbi:energy transducer TonB [Kordia jejudonensis]|uniref:energy transducer TonB n=1 Tax=Kordia jejudonensis TaxID=1348245 RepID=UPI00069A07F9|nr:energy transducer TonB [Kordia jejudonensis]